MLDVGLTTTSRQPGSLIEPTQLSFKCLATLGRLFLGQAAGAKLRGRSRPLLGGEQRNQFELPGEVVVTLLHLLVALVQELRYARIYLGSREFFEQVGLFLLGGFEEGGEVALGQQHRPCELVERQSQQLGDATQNLPFSALFFDTGGEIVKPHLRRLQRPLGTPPGPTHSPTGPIKIAVERLKIGLGIPLGCSPPQQRAAVVLREGLVGDIGQQHTVFPRPVHAGCLVEKRETQGIEQRRLSGAGRSCYGKKAGRGKRFACKIDRKFTFERSEVFPAYG